MTKIIKRIWQGNEIPATKYFLWIKNEDGLYYIYVYGPDGWEKLSTNEFDPDKYYTKEEIDELLPDLSDYYTKEETYSKFEIDERIPTKLSDLQEDNTHRVVSDEQITNWNRAYRAEFDTTRTIWGQSLNGNQNIIGNMEGVGNIVPDVDGVRNIGSTLKKFNIIYADSILGNANTATALSDTNAYTAWGRTFFLNGKPQSIWGNITNVGDIFFSNNTTGARYFNLPSGSDMIFRKAKDAATWRTWMTVSGTDTTNVTLGSETSDVTIFSGNDLKLKTQSNSVPTVVTISPEDITAKKNNTIASVNLGTNAIPFKELYLNPDNGSVLAIGASVRSLLNTQSNLGTAAYSNVASGISENNNDLATSGQVYSYVATKIASGLYMRGVTTTPLVDQCNTNPITINGTSYTAVVGDLVLLDSSYKEFMWDGVKWNELGDGTSYAIKTVTFTIDNTDTASNTRNASTSYITGGGDLQANRTFAVTTYLKDAVDWGNVILGLQGVGMLEKTASGWQISTLTFSGTRDFLGVRYWDSSSNGPLTVTSGVLNLSESGSGLMLPLAAPSSAVSGKVYLWSNAEGNYSSTPSGGGISEVSTLYLYKNNTLIDSYNGTVDKSIHIPVPTTVAELSDSSNYALKTWVNTLVETLLGNYVTLTGDPQHITSKKYIDSILVEALLALPESAPSPDTADESRIFLWANSTGNYSSSPSGGGGTTEISPLHFTRNNQNIGNYDGTVETTINIAVPTAVSQLSDASNYATKAWVEDKHYLVAADLNNYVTLDTEQTITGKKTIGKILVTGYLNIPTSAPSATGESPLPNGVFLWGNADGNYSSTPSSGGITEIEPLHFTRNNQNIGNYDGTVETTINISVPTLLSQLTDDASHRLVTDTQITNWTAAYNWGDHSQAGYVVASTVKTLTLTIAGNQDAIGTYSPVDNNNTTFAVTKAHLVAALDSDGGYYLPLTGGTLTGNLTIGSAQSPKNLTVCGKTKLIAELIIPKVAPTAATIEANEIYFWGNSSGNYSSTPSSGGVTEIATLTISRNNQVLDTFDGSVDKTINISVPVQSTTVTDDSGYFVSPKWVNDNYTLLIASASRLGGVKIGNAINIAADGTISVDFTGYATTSALNGVSNRVTTLENWKSEVKLSVSSGILQYDSSPLFSALSNSNNQISLTIGGQTRTLTVAYATAAAGLTTQGPFTVWGQTYWNSGVPNGNITGAMSSVTNINQVAYFGSGMLGINVTPTTAFQVSGLSTLPDIYTSATLAIPVAAPNSSTYYNSARTYLWANASGNYSSTPSGGSYGEIATLTITRNNVAIDTFDGTVAKTINIQVPIMGISNSQGEGYYVTPAYMVGILGDSTFSSSNTVKSFVNSSIATATATYCGSYNCVSDLSLAYNATHAQIEAALATAVPSAVSPYTPDNNDYCFVEIPTSGSAPTEIAKIERYKFNGTSWAYEYQLNNSGFTSAQWAAVNSGITSSLVTAFGNKYDKPSGGIPASDLAETYLKTSGGSMINTNLVTNLNADLLDGWHKESFLYTCAYHCPLGYLVKTKIATTDDAMIYVQLEGNSYWGGIPIVVKCQLYNYPQQGAMISYGAWVCGSSYAPTVIKAFYYNGYIYLWFQQTDLYQTYYVNVWTHYNTTNQVDTITNSAVPDSGVSQNIDITPYKVWHSNNSNLISVAWSASNLTLNGYITGATSIDSLLYFDTTNSRVGIGTSVPAYKLDVGGSLGVSGTLIVNPGNNGNWTEGIRIKDASDGWTTLAMGGSSDSGTSSAVWSLHTYQNNFYLANDGSSSFTNGISCVSGNWSIMGTGNVGIGTTSPSYKLDVNGSIYASGNISAPNGYVSATTLYVDDISDYSQNYNINMHYGVIGSNNDPFNYIYTESIEVSNSLAIPTIAPSSPVSGKVYLYSNTSGNYSQTPSGGGDGTTSYALTLRVNSVKLFDFDGSVAVDQNITIPVEGSSAGQGSGYYASPSYVAGNYLNLGGGTMSNTNLVTNLNADTVDSIHASQFVRNDVTSTQYMSAGAHVIFAASSTDTAYGGSFEFREYNYVVNNQTGWAYAPSITFHWGGLYVSRVGLRSDGKFAIDNVPFALQESQNNFVHSGNEITMVPSAFSGSLWLNFRTTGGYNGNISEYMMCNGAQGYAYVRAAGFVHNSYNSSSYVLTSEGGATAISGLSVSSATNSTYFDSYDLRNSYPADVCPAYKGRLAFLGASTLGITGYGTWYDTLILRSYADYSAGNDSAIMFDKNGNDVWHTSFPFGSTNSWGTPILFIDTNNWSSHIGTSSSPVGYATNASSATSATIAGSVPKYIKDFSFLAGGSYTGWISIAKLQLNDYNYFDYHSFNVYICREFSSPSSESYAINVTIGWCSATCRLLSKNIGAQIIEQFRVAKDATNHYLYLQVYVNPNYSTYSNGCSIVMEGIMRDSWTSDNTVNSSVTNVSTLDLTRGTTADSATNADTVDNEHASAFLHLTGGTLTGTLTTQGILMGYGSYLYRYDSNGDARTILDFNGNHLELAYGNAAAGYDTSIHGNQISLRYGTGHSLGLYINSSGNVGIGTTSPTEKLDVNGNGNFNGFVTCNSVTCNLIGTQDYDIYFGQYGTGGIIGYSNRFEEAYIKYIETDNILCDGDLSVTGWLDVYDSLSIPTSAPSSPTSGRTYFWLGNTGSYVN